MIDLKNINENGPQFEGFSFMYVSLSFLLSPILISLFDFDSTSSWRFPFYLLSFYYYYSFIIKAALAIFLAFLNTNISFIIMKNRASNSPIMEITMKIMWGIKLESVIAVVGGRLTYFGIKINMMIRITGTISPIIE